jgi:hypothetical protein
LQNILQPEICCKIEHFPDGSRNRKNIGDNFGPANALSVAIEMACEIGLTNQNDLANKQLKLSPH